MTEQPESSGTPLLRMSGIGKSFGGLPVLTDVSLELRKGEVHILAGENGAGKSTLMKILAGVHRDYRGTIELNGKPIRFRSPRHAFESGVGIIYQELSLVDSLSVADNLHLGREVANGAGWVDAKREAVAAVETLRRLDLQMDVSLPAEEYPLALRQMLEIAKAVSRRAEVLVMDEPTSALSDAEVERLFSLIRSLKERGTGIVYITHKMEEIERIGDRITILRDGRNAGTGNVREFPREEIIRRMVGREIRSQFPHTPAVPGEAALVVEGLTVESPGQKSRLVDGVSLSVHGGEIVGIAGLQGCGNSELLRALFGGMGRQASGLVITGGRRGLPRVPSDAIEAGMALLTNDRKGEGIVEEMSVGANMTLAALRRFSAGGWIRKGAERKEIAGRIGEVGIRAAGEDQEAGHLSGGNQQKVLFARWLATAPRVLLLDDPTRGVDVGAKQEIYSLLMSLKSRGVAILLTSSETPELLGLSDRILVMREGRIVGELSRGATQEAVLRVALGVRRESDG